MRRQDKDAMAMKSVVAMMLAGVAALLPGVSEGQDARRGGWGDRARPERPDSPRGGGIERPGAPGVGDRGEWRGRAPDGPRRATADGWSRAPGAFDAPRRQRPDTVAGRTPDAPPPPRDNGVRDNGGRGDGPGWDRGRGADRDRAGWQGRGDDRRDWRDRNGRDDRDGAGWNGGGWNGTRGRDDRRWYDGSNWGRGQGDRRGADRGWDRGWDGGRNRGWDRAWRNDGRYDWGRYRTANRGTYRLPRYYAPYGWNGGYRRFGIGLHLSSVLFAQDYWIGDPWSYRLPDPYGPYQWVRYYNDALLVDVETGEVVDSVYGIFW